MIKIVLAGVWACIATLVAVYFSVQMATAPNPVDDGSKKPELEVVRGEAITIPVFANGSVNGYFLGRFSFMVQKEKAEAIKLPLPPLMTDELYRLLVDNKIVDLTKATKLDAEGFRNTIKADLNKHLGEGVIADVLIEQLDYLGKEETQDGGGKPKLKPAVKIVEGQPPAATMGEKSGH
jgi:flagellar basal body-associated protein FliL